MSAFVKYMQSNRRHESVHTYGVSGYDNLSMAVLVECVAATGLLCSGVMPVNKYWTCAKKYVTRINMRSYYTGRVIKSRRMRWAGHVARMGEERGCIGPFWGNRREGDHWGDLGVHGWIILGWISRRWDVGIWTGLGWPRIETGGGRL